jgi:bacteriocin-like protein
MTFIKTSDLYPSRSDLFVNSEASPEHLNESDLEELSESDLAKINGGGIIPVIVWGYRAYKAYQAYQNYKD